MQNNKNAELVKKVVSIFDFAFLAHKEIEVLSFFFL
jgi:hypothetical protein